LSDAKTDSKEQPTPPLNSTSWVDTIQNVRDGLKIEINHFEENFFYKIDSFFRLTQKLEDQIIIVTRENTRLMELCTKHKIDTTPPAPKEPKVDLPKNEAVVPPTSEKPKPKSKTSI